MNKKNVAIGILAGTTLYFWFSGAYILIKRWELEVKYANLAREYESAKAIIDEVFDDIVKDI